MLAFGASRFFQRKAIITDDGTTLTYADINGFSESVSRVIPDRCLVFCLCQNTPGSLCGYLSFISNKIVPVMLETGIDKEFFAGLIKIYKPQYIWLPDSCTDGFKYGKIVFSDYHYSMLKLVENNHFKLHEELAMLLPTSGSTGSSKFVRISYENLESNADSIASYLSIDENERPITTLPMSYSYGLSVINSHILKGASILLTPRSIMEKKFWTLLKSKRATSLSGVPYTYKILDRLQFTGMELPSLKTITQAGGKLNDDLNRKISDYCLSSERKFFVMYGQTEATARMSYLPSQYSLSKSGSIGIAIPGGEFSLKNEEGTEIKEHDIAGELVYKGKNVSMGYANGCDDLAKGDENHGVLYTGDLAKKDRDDFFYLVGRKGRFFKMFGKRVSLDDAEHLLEHIIPDCACTGHDDCMIIHLTDQSRTDEIKKYLSVKTGIHPSAFFIKYRAEIPRNPAGKTDYSKLELS